MFKNLFDVMAKGAKCITTHTPDARKKRLHIESYDGLNWDKKRIEEALVTEEKRLWVDIAKMEEICLRIGFSSFEETPINDKLWQSTHMMDFVVTK